MEPWEWQRRNKPGQSIVVARRTEVEIANRSLSEKAWGDYEGKANILAKSNVGKESENEARGGTSSNKEQDVNLVAKYEAENRRWIQGIIQYQAEFYVVAVQWRV